MKLPSWLCGESWLAEFRPSGAHEMLSFVAKTDAEAQRGEVTWARSHS